MASYPSSVFTKTQHNVGDTLQPADVNNLEDETVAVEGGLLNGFAHTLLFGTDATYNIGASGANRPLAVYVAGGVSCGGVTVTGQVSATGNVIAGGFVSCTGMTVTGTVTITGVLMKTGARSHATVTQTTSAVTATAITFGTNDYNDNAVWAAGNPSRFTAPVAGRYIAMGGVALAATATTYVFQVFVRVNGNVFKGATSKLTQASEIACSQVFDVLTLNANDYVEFMVGTTPGPTVWINPGSISPGGTQDVFGSLTRVQ